ncbi:MFS transporter [Blastococcus saxobsidens]|uniref:YNFM family putative membrane transporter n=1 Tax=Blastococcus saxobsidens TaxID=138336 RepID=A0A4Q7Y3Z7_9ACTN|nr:MFS transporter [Blastococcus saxobsidens]RZU31530.1 YNFM family putative membrane transporter [Blastococcus saxobsidens]
MTATAATSAGHARGTRGYRRLVAAIWAAGVGCFAVLYAPQAILPLVSDDLGVPPSSAALLVSATTGTLALALLPMSYLADRVGRTRLMTIALVTAAVLGVLAPVAPSFEVLLLVRAVQGVAMAGLPALAMAHLSEQVRPSAVGVAMGLFVAGNTAGGLSGRVVASAVADGWGWRAGLGAVGGLALVCAVAFRLLLPPPVVQPAAPSPVAGHGHLRRHLRDPGIRRLCLSGFVLMAAFVTVYNFLGYRLLEEPFGLSPTLVGLVFLVYLAGTLGSPAAGRLGERLGRRVVLLGGVLLALAAVLLTLSDLLAAVLVGLVLFTVGFFAAHTSASGMVGNRARVGRAHASALYLLAYYAGSSVGGWLGGFAYEGGDWPAVVAYVATLLLAALGLALLLRRTPALPTAPTPAG